MRGMDFSTPPNGNTQCWLEIDDDALVFQVKATDIRHSSSRGTTALGAAQPRNPLVTRLQRKRGPLCRLLESKASTKSVSEASSHTRGLPDSSGSVSSSETSNSSQGPVPHGLPLVSLARKRDAPPSDASSSSQGSDEDASSFVASTRSTRVPAPPPPASELLHQFQSAQGVRDFTASAGPAHLPAPPPPL